MLPANLDPVLNANYTALTGNGAAAVSPDTSLTVGTNSYTPRTWLAARRLTLTNELAKLAAPFAITNNNGNNFTTSASSVVLGGKAPMEVASIRINNTTSNAPVTWNTITNWTVSVALTNGANPLTLRGYDQLNVSNAAAAITITRQ